MSIVIPKQSYLDSRVTLGLYFKTVKKEQKTVEHTTLLGFIQSLRPIGLSAQPLKFWSHRK